MRLLGILLLAAILAMPVLAQDDAPASPGETVFDEAVVEYRAGNLEAAKAKFLEALGHFEGNNTVLTWLGTTCYELKQWDEAIDYLTQATETEPEDTEEGRRFHAVTFNNLGNAYLEKAGVVMKEDEIEGRAVLGKAIGAYQQAMELDTDYLYPVFNLALAYTRMKEWDKAFNRFHEALNLCNTAAESFDVEKSFAGGLKQASEYEKAVEHYEKALEYNPSCVSCQVQLGWLHSKAARWPQAETAYGAAVAADEGIFDAQLGLGIAQYSQRKFAEAKAPLTKATELQGDSFEAWYNLGLTADGLSDLATAATAYGKAVELKPDDASALNNLGVVVYKQDKPCDAIPHFRAATAADADYVMAYINLALALEACGQDDDEVLRHWQTTVERFPRQASAHCGLANALYRREQVNQALAEYLKCLQYDDRNVEAHNNVGLIHMERDQLAEALAHFRQALNANPNYVPAINNLGVLYEKQGNIEEAKEQYRKALQIDPDYANAKENLRRLGDTDGGGQ